MAESDRTNETGTKEGYEAPRLTRHRKLVDITMYTFPTVTVTG